MISISIKVDIPEFDKFQIEIPCPLCRLHTWVRLGEIRKRDFVICRGCHVNILLEDHMAELHKFIASTKKILKKLGG